MIAFVAMARMQQTAQMGQQQVLSPQMQQSLEILQVTAPELDLMIRREMESNPALELESPEKNASEVEEVLRLGEEEPFFEEQESSRDGNDEEMQRQHFLDGVSPPETLAQYLEKQLGRQDFDPIQRRIATLLVGNLNEDGYLAATVEEVAQEAHAETRDVLDVLKILQSLEPAGVGAKDLAECLFLQLARRGEEQGIAARIVAGYLDELGGRKFEEIAAALGVSVADVREAGVMIARLHPKPGRAFAGEVARVLVPDVMVERDGEDYVVFAAHDSVPHLRISRVCRDLLGTDATPEVREYLREKIRGGRFLIKSIQQRQDTILAIAREMVRRQRAFLDQGVSALVPMSMAQVAETLGMHETTVGRALSGKNIATPQGVFEMKSFFTQGLSAADGSEVSSASIKNFLGALIRAEDASHPLSDQEIMERLREQGFTVARRTVAKYREDLGILPSSLRKSF